MQLPKTLTAAITGAALGFSSLSLAQTEIQWWHAMDGRLGDKVNEIAEGFNASQDEYVLNPTYKGNYTETMTAAIAAFRAKQQPHIVQVFEVGTATMMAAEGAIYPVYQLMDEMGEPFNPDDYLSTVTGYYTDTDGNMLSMPFNSSTPVLYYNKDLFEQAGLDPDQPPKTGPELGEMAKKLQEAGVPCGFTTGWQSWVQLENFSAWHNVPLGTQANGFGGLDTEFVFNGPLQVKHIQQLADWQQDKIFDYGGRRSDSGPKFYSGECAMYMNSSAAYAGVRASSSCLTRCAAEHHHRRGDAVGVTRSRTGGLQRRGQIFQLSVLARSAGRLAPIHRLSADHQRGLRTDQGAGVLRRKPRHRHRHPANDPERTDREF